MIISTEVSMLTRRTTFWANFFLNISGVSWLICRRSSWIEARSKRIILHSYYMYTYQTCFRSQTCLAQRMLAAQSRFVSTFEATASRIVTTSDERCKMHLASPRIPHEYVENVTSGTASPPPLRRGEETLGKIPAMNPK